MKYYFQGSVPEQKKLNHLVVCLYVKPFFPGKASLVRFIFHYLSISHWWAKVNPRLVRPPDYVSRQVCAKRILCNHYCQKPLFLVHKWRLAVIASQTCRGIRNKRGFGDPLLPLIIIEIDAKNFLAAFSPSTTISPIAPTQNSGTYVTWKSGEDKCRSK